MREMFRSLVMVVIALMMSGCSAIGDLLSGNGGTDEVISPEMIFVEGGTFTMGSNDGNSDEKPPHQVTLSSFMISKYEVTQELWDQIMMENPSEFRGSKRPVECVSWYDALVFCNALSRMEGLQEVYSDSAGVDVCNFEANGYRLPTEAEWEYAARGGNKSRGYKYSGSNDLDAVGWYHGNSGDATRKVGLKQPNELGIYDMSGNVREWCWDVKGAYDSTGKINPRGPETVSNRVFRGGSWFNSSGHCRVSFRNPGFMPGTYARVMNLGFRVARTR